MVGVAGPPPGEVIIFFDICYVFVSGLFENRGPCYTPQCPHLPLTNLTPAALANVLFVLEFFTVFINEKELTKKD